MTKQDDMVIALSKGRILDDTLPLLAKAGIEPLEDVRSSRKLIFPTNQPNLSLIVIRATDVPTYVERGVAHLGIAGKDVLMEHGAKDIYELLDLRIARCRLMTAGIKGVPRVKGRVRVASKFTSIARSYFAERGKQVDIIKLYGGMELAPLLGLADEIVDIVDTGKTLTANGLEPRELIADISSRLIVSRAAYKRNQQQIDPIVEKLAAAMAQLEV